ncbi:hypothetical protein ACKWTF_001048 [Chironomus riparius]
MITSEFKFRLLILLIVVIIPDDSLLQRISEIKCKEFEEATQTVSYVTSLLNFPSRRIVSNKCQHQSIALIVGGSEAKKHEFPHQALLGYDTSKGIAYYCGGSLISSQFILTAAHCLVHSQYGQVKYVKLGMNSRSQADDKVFTYGVEKNIKYAEYNARFMSNDIALLKLNGTVTFTEFLYPACLPTSEPNHDKAIVTGFGKTHRTDASSEKLMKVTVHKFDQTDCQIIIRQIRINKNSMICYGNKTHPADSCQGDSGGPIQVGNDKVAKCTYKVIGVVNFGAKDCGTPGVPSVYANVYYYLKWIEDNVWGDEQS